MQQVKTPYELDDIALPNLFCPPDPTQGAEQPAEHLTEAEAEDIFRQAEQEIQPILRDFQRWKRKDLLYGVAELLCCCLFLSGIAGIVWQCITYPHTLVLLYTKATPATITTPLDLPTRPVAPVTITRSATTATTGIGHQDARVATGSLLYFNGSFTPQTVDAGTVYTGSDGIQVVTDQTITIPAGNPPTYGEATAPAHATRPGSAGNIHAGDITITVSSDLLVRNTPFAGGRDARTFRAVAPKDLRTLTAAVSTTLMQAFTNAFPLRPGEAAIPTACHVTTSASHQIGEEAQTVMLTASKTCAAVAYNQGQLTHAATAAFTKTRPGGNYHIVGSVQTTLESVTPLTVTLSGKWAYTFSQGYQDFLAEQIQGDTPEKARAYLLKTGVISYASVPNTLASADYISFFVLVG